MSQAVFEQVLISIQSLPPELLAKLREILNAPSDRERRLEAARALAQAARLRDLSAERQWLKEHCDEYVGQWVALKGDHLISHGKDHLAVYQAAKAAGHPDALLELVGANGEAQRPEVSPPSARTSARAASLRDFTADRQWLADHRDEYAGQWVALEGGRLISHGANAKEVHQAAQDAGHSDALLVLVEPSDAPPFIL
jgi:Family of unknown function (DUF5678)